MSNTTRFDAWTAEHDKSVAETILQHISTGGTLGDAYAVLSDSIGRTPGAIAYRWHTVISRKVHAELAEAKRKRRAQILAKKQQKKLSQPNKRADSIYSKLDRVEEQQALIIGMLERMSQNNN